MKYVIGVDVSLNHTGLAVFDNMGKCLETRALMATKDTYPDWKKIDDQVAGFFDALAPYLGDGQKGQFVGNKAGHVGVCFEDYAFNARTGKSFTRAEVAGVLKYNLRVEGTDIIAVPPLALKKWLTGRGNAKKEAMKNAVFKRWGHWTVDDNIADAYALGRFGYAFWVEKDRDLPVAARQNRPPLPDFRFRLAPQTTDRTA